MKITDQNETIESDIGLSQIEPLTNADFERFRELIKKAAGISLNDTKQQLVASRLARRLRHLSFTRYSEYWDYLKARNFSGDEMTRFINAITTNKTSFFRESHHFEFLAAEVLSKLVRGEKKKLRIWSAACSTGEEPYTIAMTAAEAVPNLRNCDFKILATDIDTDVLQHAGTGEYAMDRLEGFPDKYKKYLAPSQKSPGQAMVVRPELRQLITFNQMNFMLDDWPVKAKFDVIFCRNVMIYFERDVQDKLVRRFAQHLEPGGYLIIGHSETLHWLPDLYQPLKGTIYRLKGGAHAAAPAPSAHAEPAPSPKPVVHEAPSVPAIPREPVVAKEPVVRRQSRPAGAAIDRPDGFKGSSIVRGEALTMRTNATGGREVSISIGGLFADSRPATVRTVLGSCIAACLFDPEVKVGGMNHFLLPEGSGDESMPTRYGINAMEVLINEIMKQGGDRRRLKAKIFGASHVLRMDASSIQVPEKNAAFVRSFLQTEGIQIISEKLGGTQPLEVHFEVTTGRAYVRALGQSSAAETAAAEGKFRVKVTQELTAKPANDAVTLF